MAASYEFRLHIQGPDGPRDFPVPLGVTTIGRMAGSSLLLENDEVSRRHAQILCTLTLCEIIDQNSSNGTFVNGDKCIAGVPVALEDGDQLKIGPFALTVSRVEVAEAQPELPVAAEGLPVEAAPAEPPPSPEPDEADNGRGAAREALTGPPEPDPVPDGLSIHSQKLIHYLPGIYQPESKQMDFMSRFLGIFESILLPIEWNVDNFDLFLNPALAPAGFLPWLANWFGVLLQPDWTEAQRRAFLAQAGFIFARRGTRAALEQVLLIFTGVTPEIDDTSGDLPAFTFRVKLPMRASNSQVEQIAALIEANKPAHTTYLLEFSG